MMLRTAEQSALVLAAMFHRSNQKRGRVSAKTIRIVSRRSHLKGAFTANLTECLAQYDISMSELKTGGFGLIRSTSLQAAPNITYRNCFELDEKTKLRIDSADVFRKLEAEVAGLLESTEDEDGSD
jgi:hypothetical protein